MNRSLLTSAALAALIAAPALAQQTGTNPNVPGNSPGVQQPGATGVQPNTTLNAPRAGAASTTALASDMTGEDLQGMTVYTTRVDTATTGSTGLTGTATAPSTTGTVGSTTGNTAGTLGSSAVPNTTDNRLMTKEELKVLTDRARSIGEVNDLLIGPDGRVQQVIIDVGGFLGVGERPVTLAWQDLKIVRSNDGDIVAFIEKSRAELNTMPQYRAPARR